MKRIAIVNPFDLVAQELREQLAERPDLCAHLDLYTTEEEEEGTVTEAAGRAALVQKLALEDLGGVDVLVLTGPLDRYRSLRDRLPAETATLLLASEASPDDGALLVAGVNLAEHPDGVMVSPRPESVMLAHLLAELVPLGAVEATATVLLPVSGFGTSALDGLLQQARDLMSFAPVQSVGPLEGQVVFNLQPTDEGPVVARDVEAVLGPAPTLSVQSVQAGIFHGLAVSLAVRFEPQRSADEVRTALETHPGIALADDAELPGPVDAATVDGLLVGPVTAGPKDWVRVWAVMDNLRVGGANNAIAIMEAL